MSKSIRDNRRLQPTNRNRYTPSCVQQKRLPRSKSLPCNAEAVEKCKHVLGKCKCRPAPQTAFARDVWDILAQGAEEIEELYVKRMDADGNQNINRGVDLNKLFPENTAQYLLRNYADLTKIGDSVGSPRQNTYTAPIDACDGTFNASGDDRTFDLERKASNLTFNVSNPKRKSLKARPAKAPKSADSSARFAPHPVLSSTLSNAGDRTRSFGNYSDTGLFSEIDEGGGEACNFPQTFTDNANLSDGRACNVDSRQRTYGVGRPAGNHTFKANTPKKDYARHRDEPIYGASPSNKSTKLDRKDLPNRNFEVNPRFYKCLPIKSAKKTTNVDRRRGDYSDRTWNKSYDDQPFDTCPQIRTPTRNYEVQQPRSRYYSKKSANRLNDVGRQRRKKVDIRRNPRITNVTHEIDPARTRYLTVEDIERQRFEQTFGGCITNRPANRTYEVDRIMYDHLNRPGNADWVEADETYLPCNRMSTTFETSDGDQSRKRCFSNRSTKRINDAGSRGDGKSVSFESYEAPQTCTLYRNHAELPLDNGKCRSGWRFPPNECTDSYADVLRDVQSKCPLKNTNRNPIDVRKRIDFLDQRSYKK